MLRRKLALASVVSLVLCAGAGVGMTAGCGSQPRWEPPREEDSFKPQAMRIHPVFTQITNWTGGTKASGVEVLIEFQDQFGDPSKATGDAVFELYQYRAGFADPRGARVVNPFVVALDNVVAQREHWNRTSRCYSFQLAYPEIDPRQTYVLTCTFEPTGGGRFFDRIVLIPPKPVQPVEPASKPSDGPGARSVKP